MTSNLLGNIDKKQFRRGFIDSMKEISDGISRMKECPGHEGWFEGYMAATDHFNGKETLYTNFADEIGITKEYFCFWGQLDFQHPTE